MDCSRMVQFYASGGRLVGQGLTTEFLLQRFRVQSVEGRKDLKTSQMSRS